MDLAAGGDPVPPGTRVSFQSATVSATSGLLEFSNAVELIVGW